MRIHPSSMQPLTYTKPYDDDNPQNPYFGPYPARFFDLRLQCSSQSAFDNRYNTTAPAFPNIILVCFETQTSTPSPRRTRPRYQTTTLTITYLRASYPHEAAKCVIYAYQKQDLQLLVGKHVCSPIASTCLFQFHKNETSTTMEKKFEAWGAHDD